MELGNYVLEGEEILQRATVHQRKNTFADDFEGTLACTPRRIVFSDGTEVTDISHRAVDAIEYRVPGIPWQAVGIGAVSILLGFVGAFVGAIADSADLGSVVAAAGLLIGALVVLAGYVRRRYRLRIHTPGQSFTFESKEELDRLAHRIRAQESKR